jgi:hypothetical protein
MLPWDNTPRYGRQATVHVDGTGEHYRLWLTAALLDTYQQHPPEERIVFLHSWNEWCEGTYLEPDERNGRFFLEQTQEAIRLVSETIAASCSGGTANWASDLLKVQREKDAGAYLSLAASRMHGHYTWRDLQQRTDELARLNVEIEKLKAHSSCLEERAKLAEQALVMRSDKKRANAANRDSAGGLS